MLEIITRYSGVFSKPPEQVSGDVESMKIILRVHDEDGGIKENVLFEGEKFNEEECLKRVEARRLKY